MIANPTPIVTSGDFNGLWLNMIKITPGKQVLIQSTPYNGEHILGLPAPLVVRKHDYAGVADIDTAVCAEVVRQATLAGYPIPAGAALADVLILAPSPGRKVTLRAVWVTRELHRPFTMDDLYAKCASDVVFAGVLTTALAALGSIAV